MTAHPGCAFAARLAATLSCVVLIAACSRRPDSSPDAASAKSGSTAERETTVHAIREKAPTPAPARAAVRPAGAGVSTIRDLPHKLTAGSSETVIAGMVTDEQEKPLPHSRLTIQPAAETGFFEPFAQAEPARVSLDAQGQFETTAPRVRYYMVTAGHDGMVTATTTLVRQDRDRVELRMKLQAAIEVSGRVDGPDGKPLDDVKVWNLESPVGSGGIFGSAIMSGRSDTQTTNGGRFTLNVKKGEVTLGAGGAGFAPVTQTVTAPTSGVVIRLGQRVAVVEGSVYDRKSGEPVTSATIMLQSLSAEYRSRTGAPPPTAMSNADGSFRLNSVPAGRYQVQAFTKTLGLWRVGNEPSTRPFAVTAGETTSGLTLFLYPGHTVRGRVTDKDTGKAVEGVSIGTTSHTGRASAKTDADGKYELAGVFGSPESARIQIEKKGYSVATPDSTNPGQNQSVSVKLSADNMEARRDIVLMANLTVSGRVVDEEQRGLAGANVGYYSRDRMGNQETGDLADRNGDFTLDVSPFTRVRVRAKTSDRPTAFTDVISVNDKPVTGVVLLLPRGVPVSGKVTGLLGEGVAGAAVKINRLIRMDNFGYYDEGGNTVSASDGTFLIPSAPADEGQIAATKDGYAPSKTIVISPKKEVGQSGLTLQLQKPMSISGTVKTSDAKAVADAQVYCYSRNGGMSTVSARTDPKGAFRLSPLGEGNYMVSVNSESRSKFVQNVAAGTEDLEIVLDEEKGATLIGHVVDHKTGQPVRDFEVTNVANVEKSDSTPGDFTIKNLRPNYYNRVTITAEGYLTENQRIDIQAGQEKVEKTFRLGPGGSVKGRAVRRTTKEPLAGVPVRLVAGVEQWEITSARPSGVATTDKDGRFELGPGAAGSGQLVFSPPSPLVENSTPVTLEHGRTTDLGDVELGGGASVKGRLVKMPGESPLSGETIVAGQSGSGPTAQRTATTDSDGRFEFTGLAQGFISLRNDKYSVNSSAQIGPDENKEVILRVGGAVLKGRTTMRGKGVSAQVNLSMTGTGMTAYKNAESDTKGDYRIEGLAAGRYRVSAYVMGGNGLQARFEDWIDVEQDREQVRDIVFPSGRLVGVVVDSAGKGVADANVSAQNTNPRSADTAMVQYAQSATSKSDGSFAFEGLTPGTYSVTARKNRVGSAIAEGVNLPADADSPAVRLRLSSEDTGTVVSIALNYTNSQPVPEAWCYLFTASGRFDHGQTRDAQGSMTIPDVPVGKYRVQVSSWGFSESVKEIEVRKGETTRLEDVLYEAGALRLNLVDANGVALPGVACTLTPDDPDSIEKPRSGSTDQSGLWIARGLFPGSYTATANAPGKKPATTKANIIAHQPVSVILKVE